MTGVLVAVTQYAVLLQSLRGWNLPVLELRGQLIERIAIRGIALARRIPRGILQSVNDGCRDLLEKGRIGLLRLL